MDLYDFFECKLTTTTVVIKMLPLRPISADLAEVAKNELNEDPRQLNSHLDVIRDWLKERNNFHGFLDDQTLLSFLRGCKFSLEKVKEKLTLFYWIRTIIPEVIQNRDPCDKHVLGVIRLR